MMPIRSTFIAFSISVILLASNWLAGCSSEKTDQQDQTQTAAGGGLKQIDTTAYADWQTVYYAPILFHYPEAHQEMGYFEDMATSFKLALGRCSNFFDVPVPDTVEMYFYTGPGQCEEITGSVYPFVKDGVVHFTQPSYFGSPMAQFMIKKWVPKEPKFRFLREGAIALLDYSNQNYYQSTRDYIDHDSLIGLAELAVDTTVNSDKERYQSALAATFVDYFTLRYGIVTLRALYSTDLPFDQAIAHATGKSVNQVQHDWLRFVDGALKAMNEKDNSIIDSIVSQRGKL